MPRLTDKERAEVITDYASGKTQKEISKKLRVSEAAVSKILKAAKSKENGKKLSKVNKSQSELRKDIIAQATQKLYERISDEESQLAPETLLKIIERLSLLEDGKKEGAEELKIIVEKKVIDLSSGAGNGNDKI